LLDPPGSEPPAVVQVSWQTACLAYLLAIYALGTRNNSFRLRAAYGLPNAVGPGRGPFSCAASVTSQGHTLVDPLKSAYYEMRSR
jgi:hypothetical protein